MISTVLPATIKGLKGGASLSSRCTATLSSSMTQPNGQDTKSAGFHGTARREYPLAALLPLPLNIDLNESTRFSPQRHRDMNGHMLAAHQHQTTFDRQPIDITVDQSTAAADAHVGRYDCTGAVSLCSSMQSNVPSPFGGMHKFTHLNMPGGQFGQGIRLVASDQQQTHYYTQMRREARQHWATYDQNATVQATAASGNAPPPVEGSETLSSSPSASSPSFVIGMNKDRSNSDAAASLTTLTSATALACILRKRPSLADQAVQRRAYSTESSAEKPPASKVAVAEKDTTPLTATTATAAATKPSRGEMLKRAVKEYGSTVIVFHVAISLASLGTCYALVSSGLDVVAILRAVGWGESALSARLEAGGAMASTFVIAYAVHKCFAPVRISITLGATPFIVRYLRRRGILRAVAPPSTSSSSPPLPPKL